ncbi:MAG: SDR family oxidoreductase [Phycisphaeraceae bacterium]|nr:SDR family oxidoreductase [Phycisphaeraceae bacterium]MBX3407985.1 SDR family oxidoreductase [Phycisphaeraceae bacterium]
MSAGDRPVALVTGGARRVGRAVCLSLARAGCDVVLTYNRSAADAERTAAEARSLGVRAEPVELRIDDGAAPGAASRIATLSPRWDVLVHNASSYEPSPLPGLTAERAQRDYAVNALAPLLLSRALAPALAASSLPGGGAIVAMADIHALGEHGLPRANFISYAMSKAALVEMVRSLARELAPRVRVNAVAPGVVAWPEAGHESHEPAQREYLARVPLGRAGTPEDAAEAVRWLALDAHYVTGQVLRLDGGRSML